MSRKENSITRGLAKKTRFLTKSPPPPPLQKSNGRPEAGAVIAFACGKIEEYSLDSVLKNCLKAIHMEVLIMML